MPFRLCFAGNARNELQALEVNPAQVKRYKAVRSALGKLQNNPRHPGLSTHKYSSKRGANGEEVFEAYSENNTPGAYRIFWHYGPDKDLITVIAITPHP
jgi:hypothetical protein